jgi:hypothetical protein
MTYAIVGLGVASAAQQCQGGEVSEDGLGGHGDHCCKVSTWSAYTYKEVKGTRSWRRWREKLLRIALESALSPSDMGLPTKIHQVAYNAGLNEKAAVSQALIDKTAAALHNFRILFPFDRWWKKKNCKRGDYDDGVCTGGEKTLSCWKSNNPPHTPEMAALLSSVVGVPITVQHLQSIGEWDQPYFGSALGGRQPPQVPQAFMDWLMSVYSQWEHMPLAMNGQYAGNEKLPKAEDFFVAQGGVVKPTAWMEKFIGHMTRKQVRLQVAPSLLRRAVQPKPQMTASAAALQRVVQAPAPVEEAGPAPPPVQPSPTEPEGMDPKMLAIGGVALVGLGFGAFVLLRKK